MHKKILLVEDDEEIREIYKLKFTLSNFDVLAVADGAMALSKIEIELPDIILLDILLPNKDGFEILKEIKSAKNVKIRSIPVFMLTNLSNEQDKEEAAELGATNYLVKAKNSPQDIVSNIEYYFKNNK